MEKANNAVLCNGTLSLLRHCSVSLLRTILPRSRKAHASPSFSPAPLPPLAARCPAQPKAAPPSSHQRCHGDPAPQVPVTPGGSAALHGTSPASIGMEPPGPAAKSCSCFSPVSTLFKASGASMTPAWQLFPSTPSRPFLQELLPGESAAGPAGQDNAGARAPSDKPAQAAARAAALGGAPGEESRPGWFLPANFSSRGAPPALPPTARADGRAGAAGALPPPRGPPPRARPAAVIGIRLVPAPPRRDAPGAPAGTRSLRRARAAPSRPPPPDTHPPSPPSQRSRRGPGNGPRSAAGSGPPPPSPAVAAPRMRSPHRR